jgi:hypothetical protein
VDGDLAGIGPGDQVRHPNHVEEMALVDPAPLPHEVVVHRGYVSVRAAEPEGPEAEEVPDDFPVAAHVGGSLPAWEGCTRRTANTTRYRGDARIVIHRGSMASR